MLRIYGPLIFWTIMFVIGAAIKLVSFDSTRLWFDIAPDASLWATGILFTLVVSRETYFQTRLVPHITRKSPGPGHSIDYEIVVGDIDFTPKFMYLFLAGVAVWILSLLLCGYASEQLAAAGAVTIGMVASVAVAVALAAGIVILSVYSLYEVTR